MKNTLKQVIAVAIIAAVTSLNAADKKHLGGPKGGRLLEKTEPKVEFFVEKDHSVSINFYDANLKPVPVTNQSVTIIAETKAGKDKIEFEKKGESLVSKSKLPPGDGYNVVVQFKPTADAKPQNYRFLLDLGTCGGCKRPEYACICDE
jgi:hypothetical protein